MSAFSVVRISLRHGLLLVMFVMFMSHSHSYQYYPYQHRAFSRRNIGPTTLVQRLTANTGSDGDATDEFDIEATRQKLESLLSKSEQLYDTPTTTPTPAPAAAKSTSTTRSKMQSMYASLSLTPIHETPLLTSIERERREAEIQVLQRLDRSDDAMDNLWTLWFQERGADAAKRLTQGEQLASHPPTWTQAESVYRELIAVHGVHWAEPVNKLATLYFLQGRLQESAALCKIVLAVKPWHFGALSGMVAIYVGLQDMEKAKHWAAARLPILAPPGSPNKRRDEWVRKAVSEATQSLAVAERQLIVSFGRQDHDETGENNLYCNELDDKDSWQ